MVFFLLNSVSDHEISVLWCRKEKKMFTFKFTLKELEEQCLNNVDEHEISVLRCLKELQEQKQILEEQKQKIVAAVTAKLRFRVR